MNYAAIILGSSPAATIGRKILLAFLRALRTFLQGTAAALVSAFPGEAFFDTTYWKAFGFAVIAAGITAAASFLHNVAGILPADPTQQDPGGG